MSIYCFDERFWSKSNQRETQCCWWGWSIPFVVAMIITGSLYGAGMYQYNQAVLIENCSITSVCCTTITGTQIQYFYNVNYQYLGTSFKGSTSTFTPFSDGIGTCYLNPYYNVNYQ